MPHKTIIFEIKDSLCLTGTDFDLLINVKLKDKSSSVALPLLSAVKEYTMITIKLGYEAAPGVHVVVYCRAMDQINNSRVCYIVKYPGDYVQLMKINGIWVHLL